MRRPNWFRTREKTTVTLNHQQLTPTTCAVEVIHAASPQYTVQKPVGNPKRLIVRTLSQSGPTVLHTDWPTLKAQEAFEEFAEKFLKGIDQALEEVWHP